MNIRSLFGGTKGSEKSQSLTYGQYLINEAAKLRLSYYEANITGEDEMRIIDPKDPTPATEEKLRIAINIARNKRGLPALSEIRQMQSATPTQDGNDFHLNN